MTTVRIATTFYQAFKNEPDDAITVLIIPNEIPTCHGCNTEYTAGEPMYMLPEITAECRTCFDKRGIELDIRQTTLIDQLSWSVRKNPTNEPTELEEESAA